MYDFALSPYMKFPRHAWRKYRKDTPMLVDETDLNNLRGKVEPISLLEIEEVYLPLARLLNLYIEATQNLHKVSTRFLDRPEPKVPYIIGVVGSVAVGKSTTSRILQSLLSRWPHHSSVDIVNTDGFIYPNAILEERQMMSRKGFPESYNLALLMQCLTDLKSGKCQVKIPIYSHYTYDIEPGQYQVIEQPDIVIVEGLNLLQVSDFEAEQQARIFLSDFFDFTIYVDAQTEVIKQWFLQRFMLFRSTAKQDPDAYFNRFSQMSNEMAQAFATDVWTDINEANLIKHILPFKERAKLILVKDSDHSVQEIYLRKI
jgi:type I pantothenate kinase